VFEATVWRGDVTDGGPCEFVAAFERSDDTVDEDDSADAAAARAIRPYVEACRDFAAILDEIDGTAAGRNT